MTDPTLDLNALERAAMRRRFGVQIVEHPWVPADQAYIFGPFDRPEGWDAMPTLEKLQYAVDIGAVVLVKNIGA